jgi:hypothetical protein
MESNLRRVAPPWSLHRSFAIRSRSDGTVELPVPPGPETFGDEDRWTPKHDHWWIFPVDPRTGQLDGAARAVFEAVRFDASVKKILLEGSQPLKLGGDNVVTTPMESPPGQMYALRARTIFVTVGPRADVNHPVSGRHHRFVRLADATGLPTPPPQLTNSWGSLRAVDRDHEADLTGVVVVASDLALDSAQLRFPRVADDGLWLTGSPRVDLLLMPESDLSRELAADLSRVRSMLAGRRAVLVAPLDLETGPDLDLVAEWAASRPDVAVCVLTPPGPRHVVPAPLVDLLPPAHQASTPQPPPVVEMVWRVADVLASGSAPDLADFATLGRPAIALPGAAGVPMTTVLDTEEMLAGIESALADGTADPEYLAWGAHLHSASDGHSAERVVMAVKRTYLPIDEWLAEISDE